MQKKIVDMVGGKDTPYPPPQRIFHNNVGQLIASYGVESSLNFLSTSISWLCISSTLGQ